MRTQRKILVVDDDPVVGKSFDRVLSNKGYAVITAGSGEEAIAKLGREDYAAVFTDIKMPGMSGIEVAEYIKAQNPWMPVVIITGYGSGDNQARAEAAGVCEFMHKPLSPDMIEQSADKAMHAKEMAVPAVEEPKTTETPVEKEAKRGSHLKDVALFLSAPFIGLAYILAMPFIGVGMLAWFGGNAVLKNQAAKTLAGVVAAPFIGLAFIVVAPFAGLGALAWIGGKALLNRTVHTA
ncbi:MAG: response regulator [Sterolibacterium sp.]|nr:response regulator [Sterolibacterium sp.]